MSKTKALKMAQSLISQMLHNGEWYAPEKTLEAIHKALVKKEIPQTITKLKEKISALQLEVKKIQDVCPHTNVVVTSHSNTGDWDRNDDEYWNEFICPECSKYWTEP